MDNQIIILQGIRILTPSLAEYVYKNLKDNYYENWWQSGIFIKLKSFQSRDLPLEGDDDYLKSKLDIDKLTLLIADIHWNSIFKQLTTSRFRTYIRELRDIRNTFIAHLGSDKIEDREVRRAIDTFGRICEIIGDSTSARAIYNLNFKGSESELRNSKSENYCNGANYERSFDYKTNNTNMILESFCRRVVMRLRNEGYEKVVNESDILERMKFKTPSIYTSLTITDLKIAKKEANLEWIVNLDGFKGILEHFKPYERFGGSDVDEYFKKYNTEKFIKIRTALEQNFSNSYGIADFFMSLIIRFWNISDHVKGKRKGYILSNKDSFFQKLFVIFKENNLM